MAEYQNNSHHGEDRNNHPTLIKKIIIVARGAISAVVKWNVGVKEERLSKYRNSYIYVHLPFI